MDRSKEWVMNEIEKISHFGKGPRGITRLAFSETAAGAQKYVISLMEEVGLTITIDQIGNIIGRLEGKDESLPAVATGSHLDTVPDGGKYDGVIGVIGGLVAISRLKAKGKLTHPLELIIFACEESSRFGCATVGSKAMAGLANISEWRKAKDQAGLSFAEAIKQQQLDIERIGEAVRPAEEIKAFVELHIEQGRVLEKEEKKIGIVETIAAPTRLKIKVEGVAAHSGSTPMEERRDALVSASMIILAIHEIGLEQSKYGTVTTVGMLNVYPGAINVIPGVVEMWVDIRGTNHESTIECLQDIKDAISTIAEGQEVGASIMLLSAEKPVTMNKDIMSLIKKVCVEKRVPHQMIHSRAGHDAMNLAYLAPTGMIFVPSQNGVSHNGEEHTEIDEIMSGIDVLTETLLQLAK
ncbi:Zn-dependent hydrolase [Pelosinus propionicus]|uniref:N-carbamoyl-L-amino-acid hydrolase n=1 Tax=Pelosinus propionicus DSM 13327 TaxID=1123291 RepID=A0A1I4LJQ9_9FIRM|nr:Zn-dependent hydrolase [Pelosinus propionicus]SFL91212.1 N-carbamoyl-L-amino-acid hydrolase [Pelosinus propionicus DSM 13327]